MKHTMKTIKRFLFLSCCFAAVCCAKPEIPSHYFDGNDKEEITEEGNGDYTNYTEIEGTAIDQECNAVGLVYDAATKEGIAGVPVSDGYSFAVTDENGVYQMKANRYCRTIYITIPAEYQVPLKEDSSIPLFYSTTDFNRKKMNRNDFALKKLPAVENDWTLVAVGDPQCSSMDQHNRYVNETMADLKKDMSLHLSKGEYTNAYAMTLGDIVSDTPELMPDMEKSMSDLKFTENGTQRWMPFFQCIGNHDHDAHAASAYESVNKYMEHFGPVDYSFNRGKCHIIVMDNTQVKQKNSNNTSWMYDGGYSDLQWKWLQEDLKLVQNKEEMMVILVGHIPFRYGVKADGACVSFDKHYYDVLNALTEFKEAHIMIGHTHYTHNYIHGGYVAKGGLPIYEHVLCAACGAWWSSNLSAAGSPNGYTYFEITGATMKNWVARGTGMDDNDAQMRIYNGNDMYGEIVGEGENAKEFIFSWTQGGYMNLNSESSKESTFRPGQAILKDCFVAAIWGDDDRYWKVDFEYAGNTYQMQRVKNPIADMCASAFFRTKLNKSTATWAKDLKTYWYVSIPGVDPATAKGWTVKATQTIPGSNNTNVYTCTDKMQTDFTGFAH